MTNHEPTRVDALPRDLTSPAASRPQPVDNPVDGTPTAGHAPTDDTARDQDCQQGVHTHDEDGLEVAWQTIDRLSATPARPKKRDNRRRPKEHRRGSGDGAGSGDLTPVGGALDAFVDERGWTAQVGLRVLLASWPDLVGAANAEHCHAEGLHDGVLTVRADSSAWASAMRFIAPQVVATLNEKLGQSTVTRVAVVGPTGPSWKHGPLSIRDGRGPRDTYG
jgi:predicted nucleic acid-binding Zn ribbon protein